MPSVVDSPKTSAELNNVDSVRDELLGLLERVGQTSTASPSKHHQGAPESNPEAGRAVTPTPPAPATAEPEPVDPNVTCTHCGNTQSWGTASWCPRCGHYPQIGYDGEAPAEDQDDTPAIQLADLCPRWAVLLTIGVGGIVVFTCLMKQRLAGNLGQLSLASLVPLSLGLLFALIAHGGAILAGLRDPNSPGFFSLLVYPPAVWVPAIKQHRERGRWLTLFGWGVTAAIAGLSIYGPIRMNEITEMLKEQRQQRAIMALQAAKAARAVKSNGSQSIEESLESFAGQAMESAGVDPNAAEAAPPVETNLPEPPPVAPQYPQAVVFGYLSNTSGEIRTLLIARTGPDGKPWFAGKLPSDAITAEQWKTLATELPTLRTTRPLVACPNAGQWVQPRFVLSIEAERWTSRGPEDAIVHTVERRGTR